ncbi:MAG: zinc-dependent metalloprotease [Phaeodactylibacter sp.]|nr:zinc-dependent metalloprotease [Phaeodactylibacter sp.]
MKNALLQPLRCSLFFIQHPDSAQWITQQQADASAAVTFQVLNGAYKQHGIYFVNPDASCPATAAIISSSEISGQALLNAMPGAKHGDGIDVYVFENPNAYVTGSSTNIPGTYSHVRGLDGGLLANETTVAIHEVGHLLGLLHVHEDECDFDGPGPGNAVSCHFSEDGLVYLIEDEEEQQIALDSIIRLRRAMNRHARLILMTHSLDTVAVEVDSILAWLALWNFAWWFQGSYSTGLELAETYPTGYCRARHYFFAGQFGQFDTLWAEIPERYTLDEAQLDEIDEIKTVLDIIRPDLEEGGALLSQLPEATLDSLMYWKSDCTEPGALAQAVLWRNGRRLVPDCGGEAARTGGEPPVSAEEAEKAEPALIKLYPNPSQGILTLELPGGCGPATVIFYNLQGQTALKQSLSEGRHLINLPSGRFKPGVYLVEFTLSSGQRERFKLILTR